MRVLVTGRGPDSSAPTSASFSWPGTTKWSVWTSSTSPPSFARDHSECQDLSSGQSCVPETVGCVSGPVVVSMFTDIFFEEVRPLSDETPPGKHPPLGCPKRWWWVGAIARPLAPAAYSVAVVRE